MRATQWFGLTQKAQELVAGEQVHWCTEQVVRIFPDGTREPQEDRLLYKSTVLHQEGGYSWLDPFALPCDEAEQCGADSLVTLSKFTFPLGRVLFEAVQAAPWSSGPCVFTALTEYPPDSPEAQQYQKGRLPADQFFTPDSLWSQEQIMSA